MDHTKKPGLPPGFSSTKTNQSRLILPQHTGFSRHCSVCGCGPESATCSLCGGGCAGPGYSKDAALVCSRCYPEAKKAFWLARIRKSLGGRWVYG